MKLYLMLTVLIILLEVSVVQSFVDFSAFRDHCTRLDPLKMRHRHGFNKLNKPADQRKALLRGLTTELIRHGRIKTILARAKAMRKPVDHMITQRHRTPS